MGRENKLRKIRPRGRACEIYFFWGGSERITTLKTFRADVTCAHTDWQNSVNHSSKNFSCPSCVNRQKSRNTLVYNAPAIAHCASSIRMNGRSPDNRQNFTTPPLSNTEPLEVPFSVTKEIHILCHCTIHCI